jgi:thiosulfate reductase cytochrome b subunit
LGTDADRSIRTNPSEPPARTRAARPLVVRLTHWVGAFALGCMILSGWQIYNASPLLPFVFPARVTLGGWLAAGIAWHLAAMWLLFADGLIYLGYGLLSGHFRRDFLPISASGVGRDLAAALTFRLRHRSDRYNAVQRLLYTGVVAAIVLAVASGLSIWKPVQLGWLAWVFGGYDIARRIHFALMCTIVAFLVIHLALVAIFPSTLLAMLTGGRRARDAEAER